MRKKQESLFHQKTLYIADVFKCYFLDIRTTCIKIAVCHVSIPTNLNVNLYCLYRQKLE